jgi:hypothetical protein
MQWIACKEQIRNKRNIERLGASERLNSVLYLEDHMEFDLDPWFEAVLGVKFFLRTPIYNFKHPFVHGDYWVAKLLDRDFSRIRSRIPSEISQSVAIGRLKWQEKFPHIGEVVHWRYLHLTLAADRNEAIGSDSSMPGMQLDPIDLNSKPRLSCDWELHG